MIYRKMNFKLSIKASHIKTKEKIEGHPSFKKLGTNSVLFQIILFKIYTTIQW